MKKLRKKAVFVLSTGFVTTLSEPRGFINKGNALQSDCPRRDASRNCLVFFEHGERGVQKVVDFDRDRRTDIIEVVNESNDNTCGAAAALRGCGRGSPGC